MNLGWFVFKMIENRCFKSLKMQKNFGWMYFEKSEPRQEFQGNDFNVFEIEFFLFCMYLSC